MSQEDTPRHCNQAMTLIYELDGLKVYACTMCGKELEVRNETYN